MAHVRFDLAFIVSCIIPYTMKWNNQLTIGALLLLTVLTAFAAGASFEQSNLLLLILGLSGVKFLLVAFQFMELKRHILFGKV